MTLKYDIDTANVNVTLPFTTNFQRNAVLPHPPPLQNLNDLYGKKPSQGTLGGRFNLKYR